METCLKISTACQGRAYDLSPPNKAPTPVTTKRAVSVFKGNGAPWTDSGTNNFSFDESQTKISEN